MPFVVTVDLSAGEVLHLTVDMKFLGNKVGNNKFKMALDYFFFLKHIIKAPNRN